MKQQIRTSTAQPHFAKILITIASKKAGVFRLHKMISLGAFIERQQGLPHRSAGLIYLHIENRRMCSSQRKS
jgi:hypothetical protein